MKKLYVVVSPDGRTPEQVAEIREQVRSDVEEGLVEDIVLLLPTKGIEGIAADVDAIVKADIVVSTQGAMYNRDCRICNFVASEYVSYGVYEEDWVTSIIEEQRRQRAEDEAIESAEQEVQDEDVPA